MLEKNIAGFEKGLLFIVFFTLIIGQRFSIPVGGWDFPIIIFVIMFAIIGLFLSGRITMDQNRLFLYVFASFFIISASMYSVVHMKEPVITPLIYLLLFYIPFIFVYKNPHVYNLAFMIYQRFMIIVAIAGILQFLLQLTGFGFIDPIYNRNSPYFLPDYNTQIPLYFGSSLFKSNGMVMLEPSFYSKFLAIAIIIEFLTLKRKRIFLLFGTAFLFAFSGTGGIILMVAALPIIMRLPFKQVLLIAGMISIPVYLFFENGFASIMFERLNEFQNPYTSGYIRFIAPYLTFYEYLLISSPIEILLGTGPASMDLFEGIQYSFREASPLYDAHENAFIKLIMEYGVIGGLSFTTFIFYCFFSNSRYKVLMLGLFVNYCFLTGALIQAQTVYMCFLLTMFFSSGGLQSTKEETGEKVSGKRRQTSVMNQFGNSKGEYV